MRPYVIQPADTENIDSSALHGQAPTTASGKTRCGYLEMLADILQHRHTCPSPGVWKDSVIMHNEAVCDMGDVVKDCQLLSLIDMLHACTYHTTDSRHSTSRSGLICQGRSGYLIYLSSDDVTSSAGLLGCQCRQYRRVECLSSVSYRSSLSCSKQKPML